MTEPSHLQTTRAAYDTVAEEYADLLRDNLAAMPWDRAMLDVFAETVDGPVADLGCGPGRITRYLHDRGLDVFGLDLSAGMVAVARRDHPGLRFDTGSITDLDLPDGELAGIVAWYSIIHTPPDQRPTVFGHFRRTLRPGGQLLLAFQVGDERVRLEQAYGHRVSYDVYRLDPDRITEELAAAGLEVRARLIRVPIEPERVPQAYLLATRTG